MQEKLQALLDDYDLPQARRLNLPCEQEIEKVLGYSDIKNQV